jgi:hypothetical protein
MLSVDWSLKVTDLAIILATFAGPILAVWASELRQQRKAENDRKLLVFRTLMSTRAARLRFEHVNAVIFAQQFTTRGGYIENT